MRMVYLIYQLQFSFISLNNPPQSLLKQSLYPPFKVDNISFNKEAHLAKLGREGLWKY